MSINTPDPRIASYVAALEGPTGVVDYGHLHLRSLYAAYGVETVDRLLAEHWSRRADEDEEEDPDDTPEDEDDEETGLLCPGHGFEEH